jgi:hypothetical protein
MDKIVSICQGDIVLSPQYLNSMMDCMYPPALLNKEPKKYLGSNAQQQLDKQRVN